MLALLLHECFSEPINRALRLLPAAGGRAKPVLGVRSPHAVAASTQKIGLLLILPTTLILLLGLYGRSQSLPPPEMILRFSEVAHTLDGVEEPIASLGSPGKADLLFLWHENGDLIRIGIDHWGGPETMSEPIKAEALRHHYLRVSFTQAGITATLEGKVLVTSPQAPYQLGSSVVLGQNNIGFSRALPTAISTFKLIKENHQE